MCISVRDCCGIAANRLLFDGRLTRSVPVVKLTEYYGWSRLGYSSDAGSLEPLGSRTVPVPGTAVFAALMMYNR